MKTTDTAKHSRYRSLCTMFILFFEALANSVVAQVPQNIDVADVTDQVPLWETPYRMVSIVVLIVVMIGIYYAIRRRRGR